MSRKRRARRKRQANRLDAKRGKLLLRAKPVLITLAALLGLSLIVTAGMLARTQRARNRRSGNIAPQDASSPTKEYIYAAGLIATEEPASSVPNPPTGLIVTSVSYSQVTLQWSAPASGPAPTSYVVERSTNYQNSNSFTTAGTVTGSPPAVTFQDTSVTGSQAGDTSTLPVCYLYRVRSAIGTTQSNPSNLAFGTTKSFAYDPVSGAPSGTIIKATHILELRNAVSAVYATASGSPTGIQSWDSGAVQSFTTQVQARHINEMRSTNSAGNLQSALTTMGFPLPSYTTSVSQNGLIRAPDINDTRTGVKSGHQ
jgi:hypothetical protein